MKRFIQAEFTLPFLSLIKPPPSFSPQLSPFFLFSTLSLIFLPSIMSTPPTPLSTPRPIPALPAPEFPPTPPVSPRKRREAQRSSQDTEGVMPHTEYLIRSDPFRASSPYMDPLPLKIRFLPNEHSLQQFGEGILRIAREGLVFYSIGYDSMRIYEYQSAVYGSKPSQPLVSIFTKHDRKGSWSGACQAIREKLQSNFSEDFCVQILNPEKAFHLRRFAIPDGDEGRRIKYHGWLGQCTPRRPPHCPRQP